MAEIALYIVIVICGVVSCTTLVLIQRHVRSCAFFLLALAVAFMSVGRIIFFWTHHWEPIYRSLVFLPTYIIITAGTLLLLRDIHKMCASSTRRRRAYELKAKHASNGRNGNKDRNTHSEDMNRPSGD